MRMQRKIRFTARTADRHELYLLAVQSPEFDAAFYARWFKAYTGKDLRVLREEPEHPADIRRGVTLDLIGAAPVQGADLARLQAGPDGDVVVDAEVEHEEHGVVPAAPWGQPVHCAQGLRLHQDLQLLPDLPDDRLSG